MKRNFVATSVLGLSIFTSSCAVSDAAPLDAEWAVAVAEVGAADSGGIVDGSPEAVGVLRVANLLSESELVAIGLHELAAANIVAYRDDAYATVAMLDAVPYVGPIAFATMLTHAQARGWVAARPRSCAEILADNPHATDGVYTLYPASRPDGVQLRCDMLGGGWTLLHQDDFENGGAGWSDARTSANCFGSRVLGGYQNFGVGAASEKVYPLAGVPHSEVLVRLDHMSVDSWDNEEAYILFDNREVFRRSFVYTTPTRSSMCGRDGGFPAPLGHLDEVRHLSLHTGHSSDALKVHVSSTLSSGAHDESWAIDNVDVWVR